MLVDMTLRDDPLSLFRFRFLAVDTDLLKTTPLLESFRLQHLSWCWNALLNWLKYNRVFHSLYKTGRNGIIDIKDLTTAKKVNSSGARPDAIITGLGVQCLTKWAILACAI